jgi:hypothetical protein
VLELKCVALDYFYSFFLIELICPHVLIHGLDGFDGLLDRAQVTDAILQSLPLLIDFLNQLNHLILMCANVTVEFVYLIFVLSDHTLQSVSILSVVLSLTFYFCPLNLYFFAFIA